MVGTAVVKCGLFLAMKKMSLWAVLLLAKEIVFLWIVLFGTLGAFYAYRYFYIDRVEGRAGNVTK